MKRVFTALLALVLVLQLGAGLAPTARAAAGDKLVALTFDDGPGPYTARLLDGLQERGVPVTFFMVGTNVKRYPDLVARAYREGHQIANHSYDHAQLTKLTASGVKKEIGDTSALLDLACGEGTDYLVRAPYGSTNAQVRSAVGAPLVFWSVDTLDWKDRNAETVKKRVVNGAYDGAIILLHDIHSTSVTGALAAIDVLQEQGYEFVTVRQLFRRRGVDMANGTTYSSCKPNGTDLGPVAPPEIVAQAAGRQLEISLTAQEGTDIYYSLEGPELDQTSTLYTGPFTVSVPATVWAVAAYDMNGSRSAVAEQTFTLPAAQPPRLQISYGTMSLEAQTPDTQLYYTLDGTTATEASTPYTGPVSLTPGTVVSACAAGEGYLTSSEVRAVWTERRNVLRDVFPGDWYYEIVDRALEQRLVSDRGEGVFAPNEPLTRGELVTFLYRYANGWVSPWERQECPFTDLAEGSDYVDAVCWAYSKDLVDGVAEDRFAPEAGITRQEMSKILTAFLRFRGKEMAGDTEVLAQYADRDSVADWAAGYVAAVTACGLMQGGGGVFNPNGGATRAEAATILDRLQGVEQGR